MLGAQSVRCEVQKRDATLVNLRAARIVSSGAAGDREKAAAYLDLVHWRKCLQLLLLQGLTG